MSRNDLRLPGSDGVRRHRALSAEDISGADRDRFWSKVQKGDGCWEWQTGRYGSGYGMFSLFGKPWYAHRVAYAIEHGAAPADMCLCHSCDNPRCVNPTHLWVGSYRDNIADAVCKGRIARGVRAHKARLNPVAVRAIRRAYSDGRSAQQLAHLHGVSARSIHNVVSGRSWRHLA